MPTSRTYAHTPHILVTRTYTHTPHIQAKKNKKKQTPPFTFTEGFNILNSEMPS